MSRQPFINTVIVDPKTGRSGSMVTKDNVTGQTNYTKDYYKRDSRVMYFTNETNGKDMTVDGSVKGNPVNIFDGSGAGDADWTATLIAGTWTLNSTAQAQDGDTQSIDGTATVNDDILQFDNGSPFDYSNYSAISGWIYLTSWATSGTKELVLQPGTFASPVGLSVNLSNYINTTTFNSWQQFVIPLADLGLVGASEQTLELKNVDIGGGAAINFYLDALQVEETGGGVKYVAVSPGECEITEIQFTFADNITGGVAYNKFMGLASLTTGIIQRSFRNSEIAFQGVYHQLGDLLSIPGMTIHSTIDDGVNTLITVRTEYENPLAFRQADQDELDIIINDDLRSLLQLNVAIRYNLLT